MLRIATSEGSFADLKPACRFREQLVNLFELIGICAYPRSADVPPLRSRPLSTMSLARAGLWTSEFLVPPAASVRLSRMRGDAQYSLSRRGRLIFLVSAGLSKEWRKLAAERAHPSLRVERPADEVKAPSTSAIRMGCFVRRESRCAFLALSAKVLLSPIPPTL